MLFQPLVKKLRRNLNGQHLIFKLEGFDGYEPGLVRLAADVVFDYFEAVIPNGQVVLAHGEMGYLVRLQKEWMDIAHWQEPPAFQSACKILINSRKKKLFWG